VGAEKGEKGKKSEIQARTTATSYNCKLEASWGEKT